MSVIKDTIAAADDRESTLIDVPEWGVKIDLISPSADERNTVAMKARDIEGLEQQARYMTAATIIATAHDPDTGERIFDFTDDDISLIMSKDGGVLDRISAKAIVLCGLSREAVEEGKDDSSSTGT